MLLFHKQVEDPGAPNQTEIKPTTVDESLNNASFDVVDNVHESDQDDEEDEDDDGDTRDRFKSERQHIPTIESKKVVRDIPDSLGKI